MTKNKFKLSELLSQFSKVAADDGGTLYQQAANTVAGAAGVPEAEPQVQQPQEVAEVPVEQVPVTDDSVGAKAVDALKEIAMEASALEQEAIQKEASEFGKIFAQSFMEEMGMQKMATEDILMQAMRESYQATMNFIKQAEDTPPEQFPSNAIAQFLAGARDDVNEDTDDNDNDDDETDE